MGMRKFKGLITVSETTVVLSGVTLWAGAAEGTLGVGAGLDAVKTKTLVHI